MKKIINSGIIVSLLLLLTAGIAMASDDGKFTLSQPIGHGNITAEGPTGLFINPTASPLAEGELVVQYCAALIENTANNNINSHNALIAYGIKDWLEVGAIGKVLDVDPGAAGDLGAAGPFARIKVLKEDKWIPEMSAGGISIIGDDPREQHTLFFAIAKNFGFRPMGVPVNFKLNAGVKKLFFEHINDDHAGYMGAELRLPKHVYLVAEVQQETQGATAVPWSAGVQVRHPEGYGFSLAAIQPGTAANVGIFIGVGINFE